MTSSPSFSQICHRLWPSNTITPKYYEQKKTPLFSMSYCLFRAHLLLLVPSKQSQALADPAQYHQHPSLSASVRPLSAVIKAWPRWPPAARLFIRGKSRESCHIPLPCGMIFRYPLVILVSRTPFFEMLLFSSLHFYFTF